MHAWYSLCPLTLVLDEHLCCCGVSRSDRCLVANLSSSASFSLRPARAIAWDVNMLQASLDYCKMECSAGEELYKCSSDKCVKTTDGTGSALKTCEAVCSPAVLPSFLRMV